MKKINFKGEIIPLDLKAMFVKFDEVIATLLADLDTEGRNLKLGEITTKNFPEHWEKNWHRKTSDRLDSSKPKNELKGLYVFAKVENGRVTPIYLGMTQTFFRRVGQHTRGKLSNEASLAFLMAKGSLGQKVDKANFSKKHRHTFQEELKECRVAFQTLSDCNFELSMLEIYAAIKLQTYWNTFQTH